jgi:tRNA-dihydrouridine synthase A
VHARKAILAGLSPHENRTIPPLRYEVVHRLKRDFPALTLILNGGVTTLEGIAEQLAHVDGVMLGRKIAEDPYFLTAVQERFLGGAGEGGAPDRETVIRRMQDYAERERLRGVRLHHITRHMLGLYHGRPGARRWRRFMSERAGRPDATPQLLARSLEGTAPGAAP